MKKTGSDYLAVTLGIGLLAGGLFFVKTGNPLAAQLRFLPYVAIALGCGVFGHGMGNILKLMALKNSPDLQKQLKIDENDERNMAIANRAKAKAFDMMIFVFGALMLSLGLMKTNFTVLLMLAAAYLFVVGYSIFYRNKFDHEM